MSQKNLTNIRVIYADTDAMGIVYHTNYLKWFEIGRGELLREFGIPYSHIEKRGYNLPVTDITCHYLYPARYDQIVLIETEVTYLRGARIIFRYVISDEEKQKVLVEGESVHACVNMNGKVVRIPEDIANFINSQG